MNECKGCGRPILAPQQVYCGDACYNLAHGKRPFDGIDTSAVRLDRLRGEPDSRTPADLLAEVKLREATIDALRAQVDELQCRLNDVDEAAMFNEGYIKGCRDGRKAERREVCETLFRKLKG